MQFYCATPVRHFLCKSSRRHFSFCRQLTSSFVSHLAAVSASVVTFIECCDVCCDSLSQVVTLQTDPSSPGASHPLWTRHVAIGTRGHVPCGTVVYCGSCDRSVTGSAAPDRRIDGTGCLPQAGMDTAATRQGSAALHVYRYIVYLTCTRIYPVPCSSCSCRPLCPRGGSK